MSILEDILGKAVEKTTGVDEDKQKLIMTLLPIIVALLSGGGLQKIIDAMKNAGLGEQAESWVGSGENLPISGDQAKEVVGADKVAEIAEKAGIDEGKAADLVAQALPLAVDQVSPEGKEPSADAVDEALDSLKG